MINTALNQSDIKYLLEQQEKLDEKMRLDLSIKKHDWLVAMNIEHDIALNVEVHEFINECFQVWKYWKRKPMNTELILEEAIDVIHFVMLKLNKINVDTNQLAKNVSESIAAKRPADDRRNVKLFMHQLSTQKNTDTAALCNVLIILDYYGFNSQDIIHCYNQKNKENFRRLASGYW